MRRGCRCRGLDDLRMAIQVYYLVYGWISGVLFVIRSLELALGIKTSDGVGKFISLGIYSPSEDASAILHDTTFQIR